MSIYQQFGVEPIINACGSVTRLGGAPMPDSVLDAFRSGAAEWVTLEEMQASASRKIAEVTGAEAGLVTAGDAAALTLGAAAILAGHDLRRMEQLPHADDFPNEFLIAREQRSGYDHAVRASGARLVDVGFNEIVSNAGVRRTEPWDYESAITENTAGIVYVYGQNMAPSLDAVVDVARRHRIPVLVDAAGEVPPRSNLKAIPAAGPDLVAISGGKQIRGPQSTGLLFGRKELISSAALQMLDMDDHYELWDPPTDLINRSLLNGMPRHGLGRGFKVSKEEIVALLTALDLFVSGAYDSDIVVGRERLQVIADALSRCASGCEIIESPDGERWPLLEITIDEAAPGRSALEICRSLRNGSPRVFVGHGKLSAATFVVNLLCVRPESDQALASRLREELTA